MDNTSSRARILIPIKVEKPGEVVNMSDKEKIILSMEKRRMWRR
jgi:hypothetical protein